MSKGAMIGKGMTAEVYEWGNQQVLKLYYDGYQPERVRFEAEIGRAVKEAGVPAPGVYEMLEEEGRHGLLYERIPGVSMLAMIQSSPYKMLKYAREMARLHWSIHSCSTTALPRQKDRLEQAINDSKTLLGERTKLICEFMNTLPAGHWVCHGDLHPDNILMTKHQSVAIDWSNANMGDPMCDVAKTSLMLLSPYNPLGTPRMLEPLLRVFKKILHRAYLNEYCRSSNISADSMNSWILPVAAARLRDGIPGEQEWLLHLINHRLQYM
ncbi:aminoglycoside phosphotransferase family protein [Paenibacillus kribbensis]|uniref:aminoglycoside phosphotransferase family protein n=1 Tax=Paenibacillus kribbensis TaxID=172713 RepID=UPI000837EC1B|nr:aminoglycoside phosphotransferase family protein [Paenibacillus kribbensis]